MWQGGDARSKKLVAFVLLLITKVGFTSSKYIEIRHPSVVSIDRIPFTSIRGGSSNENDDGNDDVPQPELQQSEDVSIIKEESSEEEIEVSSIEISEVISPPATPSVSEGGIEESLTEDSNEVSSIPPEIRKTKKSFLSASAIERTGGAIIALIALSTILSVFGSNGIIALCLLSQVAMFKEVYSVVGINNNSNKIQKWLCFAAVQCFTSLQALSATNHPVTKCIFPSSGAIQWLGYALAIATLLSSVLSMEFGAQKIPLPSSTTTPDVFKSHLSSLVATIFILLFLLGQSTFWIRTLQLPSLDNSNYGLQCIIYSIILVIINDTMAYICGKSFGKTPLLPNLSPNKTVEGFIGAAFFTIISSTFLWNIIISTSTSTTSTKSISIILALFASFIAPFGGFLASAVKRSYGAKDFGTLIPGHGGVMDRLDCHLIMAPFTFMYLKKIQP